MTCEHKNIKPVVGTTDMFFCPECGARFIKEIEKTQSETKENISEIEDIEIENSAENDNIELATHKIFLTKTEYEFLIKLLKKKIDNCKYVLNTKYNRLSNKSRETIRKTIRICDNLINKILIQK